MQGQRSAVGSLPDSINFDCGSAPSNVGIDQQIFWNSLQPHTEDRQPDNRIALGGSGSLMGTRNQEGQTLSRWNIGEPSSSNDLPCLNNHEERMIIQNGWSSSISASSGPGSRLEDPLYEPASGISRNSVNLNLSSNQVPNGPSFIQSSHSGFASQNLDINAGFLGRVGPDADIMEHSSSSKYSRLEHQLIPSSSGPPQPRQASSGNGGFLAEDDDGRHGGSMNGRRTSCKRKSLEGHSSQAFVSENSFSREGESIGQTNPPSSYAVGESSLNVSAPSVNPFGISAPLVNPRLGLRLGGLPSDNSILVTNLVDVGGSSSGRSYWRRTNHLNQHDSALDNVVLPHVGGPHQPFRLIPVSAPLDLMPQLQPENATASQVQPVALQFPGLRRSVQTIRWSGGASSSRDTGSSSSPVEAGVVAGERGTSLDDDLSSRPAPRNISDHPMFVPSSEVRNTSQSPSADWNLNSSHNADTSRNIASSSRSGPSFGPHPSRPAWGYHRHPSSQYSRRLSEYVRRSLVSANESESSIQGVVGSAAHRTGPSASSSSQELGPPSGVHNQLLSRSGLWIDRHGDRIIGNPNSLRSLAVAGEGRSRLVSEIRNVLDMMRRGEGLRFEDVMLLNPSVIFGMADIHDQHRDMRLDVDNMSYEELLALEERIGNVCTGLSEEKITAHMKRRKYIMSTTMEEQQMEAKQCCICQEEYKEGEDLGMLDCSHNFHTECVKQWLTQKNLCPICKTTALAA